VHPLEFVTAEIDLLMGHDLSFFAAYMMMVGRGIQNVWDADKIVVIIDHFVPAPNVSYAGIHKNIRENVRKLGIKKFHDAGAGICHQVIPDKGYALPGKLIVGGDSHATTYGALGAASTGIGVSELAYVMAKGSLWFMVPETIKFNLVENLPRMVSAKDIILKIAGQYSCEVAQYKSIEFCGPGAGALSIDQRLTICNMGVEVGAKFAFFETDEKSMAYLKARTDEPVEHFRPDPDARYSATYELDVSKLEPLVACPHNVDNVKPVYELKDVPVNQAVLGSCTNGRLEDFERAAAIIKGRKIAHGVRFLVIPASQEIYNQLESEGLADRNFSGRRRCPRPGRLRAMSRRTYGCTCAGRNGYIFDQSEFQRKNGQSGKLHLSWFCRNRGGFSNRRQNRGPAEVYTLKSFRIINSKTEDLSGKSHRALWPILSPISPREKIDFA